MSEKSLNFESVREHLHALVSSGEIKGVIGGKQQNILFAETYEDYVCACAELVRSGHRVASPGAHGVHGTPRSSIHYKVHDSGDLCAVSFDRKISIAWGLLSEEQNYLMSIE